MVLAPRVLALVSLFILAGCGASVAPDIKGPQRPGAPPPPSGPTQEVPEMVVSPYSDDELVHQFEEGQKLMLAGKLAEAAAIFDKLARLAPEGPTAAPSLYNSARCHEELGDRGAAVERYSAVVGRFPSHTSARPALFRVMHLYAYDERWPDLVTSAGAALALPDLTVLEKIDALGGRALGLVEQDKLDEAERDVIRARDLIEDNRLGESGKPPIELVQVSFALGEVRRLKGEKIGFSPMPPDFTAALEQRCQALLDAQAAYTDAMRGYDARWSTMAGYRVGQLYQRLHSELMQIPPHANAKTLQQKQLFEATMRLRYRILLEKGLKMMDGTVRLADRTGETSGWAARAREAKADLEQSLAEERAALKKMPFTEEEVREAMEKLKAKSQAQQPSATPAGAPQPAAKPQPPAKPQGTGAFPPQPG